LKSNLEKDYQADYVIINVFEYQMFNPAGINKFLESGHFEVIKAWEYPTEGQSLQTYVLEVK